MSELVSVCESVANPGNAILKSGFGLTLEIPAEQRAAVALALIGGITDELIARCNDGCGLAYPLSPGTVRDGLAAVFGLDDET